METKMNHEPVSHACRPKPSSLWMRSGFPPACIATLGFFALVAAHFWPELPWIKWSAGLGSLLGVWLKLLYDHRTKPSVRVWRAEEAIDQAVREAHVASSRAEAPVGDEHYGN